MEGDNAQTAAVRQQLGERVKSTQSGRCEANSSAIPCILMGRAICEKAFGPALSVSTKLSAAVTVPQSGGFAAHSL